MAGLSCIGGDVRPCRVEFLARILKNGGSFVWLPNFSCRVKVHGSREKDRFASAINAVWDVTRGISATSNVCRRYGLKKKKELVLVENDQISWAAPTLNYHSESPNHIILSKFGIVVAPPSLYKTRTR